MTIVGGETEAVYSKFTRARLQLMLRHPYLASCLARLRIDFTKELWCKTMATDGFNIFVEPSFVEETPEDELIGVIAHEVLHVVLGHIDRRNDRNPLLWNIAIDHATNLMLIDMGFSLPSYGVWDQRHKGKTAEDIYEYECKCISAQKPSFACAPRGGEEATGSFDLHIYPGDPSGAWARGGEHPTAAERRRLRQVWTRELKGSLPGRLAGELAEEIARAADGQIQWKEYLQLFMSGLRRDDYRFIPPNRKHLWRGILLPSAGVPGPSHIMTAVDTSGSMSPDLLGECLGEIDALRTLLQARLTIIECDTTVQAVSVFEPWELADVDLTRRTLRGRGGTSFEPVFAWIHECAGRGEPSPDALVYLTDGFASYPKIEPPYPTLWLVYTEIAKDPPFGTTIRMPRRR